VSFAVLFVCTGNICRSPMAERLFRARLDPAAPVRTFGAGTNGVEGWSMDAPSARVLRELGGDPDGHVAQQITRAHIGSADLVLTAQLQHRTEVERLDPTAAGRTFTLREFGHFGAGGAPAGVTPGVDDLIARVAAVDARRRAEPPLRPPMADIGDPYGASLVHVRACGERIDQAVDGVLMALGLTPGDPPWSPGPPPLPGPPA
jgi:protein-tyrosine phosphatase